MARTVVMVAVVLAVAAAAAWQFRDRLPAAPAASAPAMAAYPAVPPDVLYSWVDEHGVTHFEQQPGRGERVLYDGSGITPMGKPDAAAAARLRAAAGAPEASPDAAAPGGLMGLRQELLDNARQMQAAKAARSEF